MKIAVSSKGDSPDSPVDIRFGRAAWFIVYNSATDECNAVENSQAHESLKGAGIQAAETVSGSGADVVVTGHCGPKAYRTLAAAGIKVYTGASGTVSDSIKKFRNGTLQEALKADVDGHWI